MNRRKLLGLLTVIPFLFQKSFAKHIPKKKNKYKNQMMLISYEGAFLAASESSFSPENPLYIAARFQ